MANRYDLTQRWQLRLLPWIWGSHRDWEPTAAQTEDFNAFRQVGDPTADALVASIKGAQGSVVRRQFEVALVEGVDAVESPTAELLAFFHEAEMAPFWLDDKKLRRGAELIQGIGPLTGPMLMVGLAVTYTTKDGNAVLLRSGDTRDKAGKRATETLAWVNEVTTPGGLERGASGYRSSLRVRLTHAFMRSGMMKRADWDNPHLAVNQQVFSNVIIAFAVIPAIAALLSGTVFSRRDREAVFHLWRYIAYLVGVDHRLVASGEDDMMRLMMLFLREVIEPDDDATLLGTALIDAYPQIYGCEGDSGGDAATRWLLSNVHAALARGMYGPHISDKLGFPRVSPAAYPLLAAGVVINVAMSVADRVPPVRRVRGRAMARMSQRLLAQMVENVDASLNETFERKQEAFGGSAPVAARR